MLQEEISITGNEKGLRPSWLSLVPDLQRGGLQACLVLHIREQHLASAAIQGSLRTAIFNLRCDSISVTKRRCFPICTLPVIWNLNGHLRGFWMESYWPWSNFNFSQRARWWDLSSFPYMHMLSGFISCAQGIVELDLLPGFREPFGKLNEHRKQADEE